MTSSPPPSGQLGAARAVCGPLEACEGRRMKSRRSGSGGETPALEVRRTRAGLQKPARERRRSPLVGSITRDETRPTKPGNNFRPPIDAIASIWDI